MKEFQIIYRILKQIMEYEKREERDLLLLSPEVLKTSEEMRDLLVYKLYAEGYVDGIHVVQGIDGQRKPYIIWSASAPSITLKGMEYLEENSMMRKAAEMAKGISQLFPKI